MRQVRYSNTKIGLYATQIDYSNYEDAGGVKIPFNYTVSWLDGRLSVELATVRTNVPVDAARFAKPTAPVPKNSPTIKAMFQRVNSWPPARAQIL